MKDLLFKIGELIAVLCRIDKNITTASLGLEQFGILIDGGGEVIETGFKGRFRIPYNGTIIGYVVIESSETPIVSNAEITLSKGSYADYDTTPVFTDIGTIIIDGDVKGSDTVLSGWTSDVVSGDLFEWEVLSNDSAEKIMVFIDIQRV